jgi:hypothetical protein
MSKIKYGNWIYFMVTPIVELVQPPQRACTQGSSGIAHE